MAQILGPAKLLEYFPPTYTTLDFEGQILRLYSRLTTIHLEDAIMPQLNTSTQTVTQSQRIEKERLYRCLGTVSVSLDFLSFPHSTDLDLENVDRLEKLFRDDGACRPHAAYNRIPALINNRDLQQCLSLSGISAGDLTPCDSRVYPDLSIPAGLHLECLRGRHRIEAASRVLAGGRRKWVVDLYPPGMSSRLGKKRKYMS